MLPWRLSLVAVLLAPVTAVAGEEHVQLDLSGTWGMELSVVNEHATTRTDPVRDQESGVVATSGVVMARITQAQDEVHGGLRRRYSAASSSEVSPSASPSSSPSSASSPMPPRRP